MQKNIGLDLARSMAALAVLWQHLCGMLYGPLVNRGDILARIFDATSGYGHQAVIIFFVLSGFLISSSVIRAPSSKFSWISYLCARVSRLWVVLIPSLLLTLVINLVGMQFDTEGYYLGHMHYLYHGQRAGPVDLSAVTLVKNILFLQTLYSNNYGDNEALWSLSYEFWYYILFPIIWRLFMPGSSKEKVICAIAAILVLTFLPAKVLQLGLVWFMGVLCALIRHGILKIKIPKLVNNRFVLIAALILSLQATHSLRIAELAKDLQLAFVFSLFVLGSNTLTFRCLWIKRIVIMLSNISYSLYATHFSVLAFIIVVGFESRFVARSIENIWIGLSLGGCIVAYSALFYWLFERNTPYVRASMEMFLKRLLNRN